MFSLVRKIFIPHIKALSCSKSIQRLDKRNLSCIRIMSLSQRGSICIVLDNRSIILEYDEHLCKILFVLCIKVWNLLYAFLSIVYETINLS